MNKDKLIGFLQSTGLVQLRTAENIATNFELREISKQDYFLKEGKISNEYLFLESGFMRAFAYDTEGNEVTTNFYSDKQVVFEVASFFNRTPARENFQAISDCRGWSITHDKLNKLFHGLPEFREFGRHMLVHGFAALKTRMLELITETAEQRYGYLLKNNPEIFQHAQLKHIASYLA